MQNGCFTYALTDVWAGIQSAVSSLMGKFKQHYGIVLTQVGAIGISAMMHGYLAFYNEEQQLAEFRTRRNTTTAAAAEQLSEEFCFNIPQPWSIAHLYQAILSEEAHVDKIASITTPSGYLHENLTGKRVLGIGDASGMFPIDTKSCTYDSVMLKKFNAILAKKHLPYTLEEILPKVLVVGQDAGVLTQEGAKLLDPTGTLQPSALLCPPEGDAGNGMVATNSVRKCTGTVFADTSIFSMIVLDHMLSKTYPEIDLVTTPTGQAVAMVHCNTCTSDLDAWVDLFYQVAVTSGSVLNKSQMYDLFYAQALNAAPDCGGLVSFNYYFGEPITRTDGGCPMLTRSAASKLSFGNFARLLVYATIATLKLGMDILFKQENVS